MTSVYSARLRGISYKRLKRLRLSWFILGILAGVIISTLCTRLTSGIQPDQFSSLGAAKQLVASLSSDKMAPGLRNVPPPKPKAVLPRPTHYAMKVGRGDTLTAILTDKGIELAEANAIVTALKPHYNPRRLSAGQTLELQLNKKKSAVADFDVASLVIKLSPIEKVKLEQTAKDAYKVALIESQLSTRVVAGGGKINSSLYQTGIRTGVPPAILGSLINAYSYDVDFQREVRRGDEFNAVYETLETDEGEIAGYGQLLYATLTIGGDEKKIYHFSRADGDTGFYDETGQSVRKAMLRTPINGARLSSGFGMRRHPILGYSKMHKGIDFAAVQGTPVYAAGDGVIEHAGRKGTYGIYVRLHHTNQYSTAYAHLSRLSKTARAGKRVKQGDIIGYVGSTGASTGPHLHYEMLSNNRQVNPKSIKFPTGHTLEGRELAEFKSSIKQIQLVAERLIHNQPTLASAQ